MKTNNWNLFRVLLSRDISKENIRKGNLTGADLREANLRGANLTGADLREANLTGANLTGAGLTGADLRWANLRWADLAGADLRKANLREANLREANLREANLKGADLRGADLREANLREANLEEIQINENTTGISLACPEEGGFIAWKKAKNNKLVKIRITENALRSSATSLKCRCSEAEVLEIEGGLSIIPSKHDPSFLYEVGKIIKVANFDINRWNECSTGIHFFMSKELAKQYS